MKLKYRVIKNNGSYCIQSFEGIWIFGKWSQIMGRYNDIKSAEEEIIKYANMVLTSHDKVVREITIK